VFVLTMCLCGANNHIMYPYVTVVVGIPGSNLVASSTLKVASDRHIITSNTYSI
jgi:hypothetical protein